MFKHTMLEKHQMELSQVKNLFSNSGISVSEWARHRGFSVGLVYQILEGKRRCERGQSHRIAVELGLKEGVSVDMDEFKIMLDKVKHGERMGAP